MIQEPLKILGINPGMRYLGLAVLYGQELLDWRIKVLDGKWSNEKIKKAIKILSDFFYQYEPTVMVIKKLHPSRRSENLLRLTNKIKEFSKCKKLKVYQYSIKEIESFFIEDEKLNKQNLIDAIAKLYPILHNDLSKERSQKNAYYIRSLEAVALASACSQRLGKS